MINEIIYKDFFQKSISDLLTLDDVYNVLNLCIRENNYTVFNTIENIINCIIVSKSIRSQKVFQTKLILAAISSSNKEFLNYLLEKGLRLYYLEELGFGRYSIFTTAIERYKNEEIFLYLLDKGFEFSQDDFLHVIVKNKVFLFQLICEKKLCYSNECVNFLIGNNPKWGGCIKTNNFYLDILILSFFILIMIVIVGLI